LWLPEHFNRICSAIDMLPTDFPDRSESQKSDQDLDPSRSGLSQSFEIYSLERVISDSQPSAQGVTPETTIETGVSNSRKKKKKQNSPGAA
jgi:hypothetical protein